MVIMVTTNYRFSKIFGLLPSSVASIILSHMYIILHYIYYFMLSFYIYIIYDMHIVF